MHKKFFLGQASHFKTKEWLSHTFRFGKKSDYYKLQDCLAKKFNVEEENVIITKNGRTALAIALKNTLPPKSEVIINGFTCYAVVEALRAANMHPVYADIDKKTLNFNEETLSTALERHPNAKAIIIQNTLGITVDIEKIEKLVKKQGLLIFEDLAHCANSEYNDGRKVGTIGTASALSFGKEKSIDSITGGALIFNKNPENEITIPKRRPNFTSTYRARFYPLFCSIYRKLAYIKLEKLWMGFLLKTHQIERSANSKLDINERPPYFALKTATKQLQKKTTKKQIRKFYLVKNRDEVLKKLKKKGYFLDGFWFETPIAPERFYKRTNFPEDECKNSVEVSRTIINLPNIKAEKLKEAEKIIKEFEI